MVRVYHRSWMSLRPGLAASLLVTLATVPEWIVADADSQRDAGFVERAG
jgi:hypothetical protein